MPETAMNATEAMRVTPYTTALAKPVAAWGSTR